MTADELMAELADVAAKLAAATGEQDALAARRLELLLMADKVEGAPTGTQLAKVLGVTPSYVYRVVREARA
jgi:hypothetical protein